MPHASLHTPRLALYYRDEMAPPDVAGNYSKSPTKPRRFVEFLRETPVWPHVELRADFAIASREDLALAHAGLAAVGVRVPDPGRSALALTAQWRRPMACADQLVLVCPTFDAAGDKAHPHPLWDEIGAAVLDGPAGSARLVRERPIARAEARRAKVALRSRPTARTEWPLPVAGLTRAGPESPSSLTSLLGCSLRWTLHYHAHVRAGASAAPSGPGPLLAGSLAHHILEHVFATPHTPDSAAAAAGARFDDEGRTLAAPLFLPRHRNDAAEVRHAIVESARTLGRILAGATIRSREQTYQRSDAHLDLAGRPDLVLDVPRVVIDFKWGTSSNVDALIAGTALQLAAYAHLVSEAGAPVRAGNFILRSQELHVEDGVELPEAIVYPARLDATWAGAQRSLAVRRAQLAAAVAHAPGAHGGEVKPILTDELTVAPGCKYCEFDMLCGRSLR